MKRPTRVPTRLSESLHKRLNAYALVASAAGVGLLALAKPAEGRIVYTPAHRKISPNSVFRLDLNHDGTDDFKFLNVNYGRFGYLNVLRLGSHNGVWGGGQGIGSHSASALSSGMLIGPSKSRFGISSHDEMAGWDYVYGSGSFSFGPWRDVTRRYLGLKLVVNGKVHYGWARLNVKVRMGKPDNEILTGYAYETVPHKPIKAGQTHSERGATLGRLAQGASGVSNGGKP
jgi:hypothetical protein